jgi:hypothetical protein
VCIEKYKDHEQSVASIKTSIHNLLPNHNFTFEQIIQHLAQYNTKQVSLVLNEMIDNDELTTHPNKTIHIN